MILYIGLLTLHYEVMVLYIGLLTLTLWSDDLIYRITDTDTMKQTKIAELFITNKGPNIWNDLEGKIDRNSSMAVFKRNIIGMIITKYDWEDIWLCLIVMIGLAKWWKFVYEFHTFVTYQYANWMTTVVKHTKPKQLLEYFGKLIQNGNPAHPSATPLFLPSAIYIWCFFLYLSFTMYVIFSKRRIVLVLWLITTTCSMGTNKPTCGLAPSYKKCTRNCNKSV